MASNLDSVRSSSHSSNLERWQDRLAGLDYINLKCLEYIVNQGQAGSLAKDLSSYVNLSRSPILKRMKQLVAAGFLSCKEIPHRNPKMPSTFVYYPVLGLSLEALQMPLSKAKPIGPRKKQAPEESELLTQQVLSTALDKENFSVDKAEIGSLIDSRLMMIRQSVRQEHLQLLRFIANRGGITMITASEITKKQRQTVNSQLQRLVRVGLLHREKQMLDRGVKEFVYQLVPDITPSDVLSYPFSGNDLPESVVDSAPQPTSLLNLPQMLAMSQNLQTSASAQSSSISAQDLARIMPPFDPTWPDDWKALWFIAFRKIVGEVKE